MEKPLYTVIPLMLLLLLKLLYRSDVTVVALLLRDLFQLTGICDPLWYCLIGNAEWWLLFLAD